jgi:hypothetical protein
MALLMSQIQQHERAGGLAVRQPAHYLAGGAARFGRRKSGTCPGPPRPAFPQERQQQGTL